MSNVPPTCSLGSFSIPFSCPLWGEGWTSKIGPIQVEGEALLSFLQLNLLTVFLTKFLQQPKGDTAHFQLPTKFDIAPLYRASLRIESPCRRGFDTYSVT